MSIFISVTTVLWALWGVFVLWWLIYMIKTALLTIRVVWFYKVRRSKQ